MKSVTQQRGADERGAALLEIALTLPLLLLVCVGILEFGRAYQTWQVLTNAAREGARVAVLPGVTNTQVETRVREYMQAGQLPKAMDTAVLVGITRNNAFSIGAATATASQVNIDYPFEFMVLQPVAQMVAPASTVGSGITMAATATMRNEQ